MNRRQEALKRNMHCDFWQGWLPSFLVFWVISTGRDRYPLNLHYFD